MSLLSDINHPTPLYTVPDIREDDVAFGNTSNTRDATERAEDQTQGRAGELIVAKFLEDYYEKDWIWLDDIDEDTAWEYDFVIETEQGGATVDVKTRRLSDIQSNWESDPDFWPRFYATDDVQKVHIHSHIYLLVILLDELPEYKDEYVAGSVVGGVNSEQILECDEEYLKNPDKIPVKYNVPASKACRPSRLEEHALTSMEGCAERGGMPSVAARVVTSSYKNGTVERSALSDTSYWNPKSGVYMREDTTVPLDIPHRESTPSVHSDEPIYYPVLPNKKRDMSVVKKCAEQNYSLMPIATQLLSNTDSLDVRSVLEYYNSLPIEVPTLNSNHIISWWVSQLD